MHLLGHWHLRKISPRARLLGSHLAVIKLPPGTPTPSTGCPKTWTMTSRWQIFSGHLDVHLNVVSRKFFRGHPVDPFPSQHKLFSPTDYLQKEKICLSLRQSIKMEMRPPQKKGVACPNSFPLNHDWLEKNYDLTCSCSSQTWFSSCFTFQKISRESPSFPSPESTTDQVDHPQAQGSDLNNLIFILDLRHLSSTGDRRLNVWWIQPIHPWTFLHGSNITSHNINISPKILIRY